MLDELPLNFPSKFWFSVPVQEKHNKQPLILSGSQYLNLVIQFPATDLYRKKEGK